MAQEGAVAYLFKQAGVFHVQAASEDLLLENLIEYDLSDIQAIDEGYVVLCDVKDYMQVAHALENMSNVSVLGHSLEWLSDPSSVALSEKQLEQNDALMDRLEQLDDTQNVFTNRSE